MDGTTVGHTRARIQQVSLELFTERGYEKTSLREIAERLGVTKAALYYHFKSKEEIVESLVDDALREVDELMAWFGTQPRTTQTRAEFLRRYSAALSGGPNQSLVRFFDSNQAAMRTMSAGLKMRDRFLSLMTLLVDPDATLTDQLRGALAVWAVHGSWLVLREAGASYEEIQAAALAVALDLLDRAPDSAASTK